MMGPVNTTACKRLFSLGCVPHTDGAVFKCNPSCAMQYWKSLGSTTPKDGPVCGVPGCTDARQTPPSPAHASPQLSVSKPFTLASLQLMQASGMRWPDASL